MSLFHCLSFFMLVLIFLCCFLILMLEYTQFLIIFLSICLRLTDLYLLAIRPESLMKCCTWTVKAQTLQVILQPFKYSPRHNSKACRCCFCLPSFHFQISMQSPLTKFTFTMNGQNRTVLALCGTKCYAS